MTRPKAEPYLCPIWEMLFEESKSHYHCPDCGTLVELGDEPPEDEPEDTE